MATTMLTLEEFLLARIAEDEEMAREAGGEWWREAEVPGPSLRRRPDDPTHWIVDSPATLVSYEVTSPEKVAHIASHDPARVLAECEAKRRLIEIDGKQAKDKGILAALALPYADHADYREEWAVDG